MLVVIIIQAIYQAFASDNQVMMATAGKQALTLRKTQQPDILLLDVMMPGMDGHEVSRRLKADPTTRDIPVIFFAAHTDEVISTFATNQTQQL